jgi:tetratricopeptide (TPR) repeat protein
LLRIYLVDGQILRDAGRPQEAIKVFTSGLEELPENADLLYARAMTAERMGNYGSMEKDLKKILARDPDNVDALNALGYSLADHTRRYKEALNYIKRALELRPDNYFVLDSMGWVHYRLGHYKEAVQYLRRALDASADSEIAAHLTEVLWVMGDKQAAREVWDKALKGAPGNKVLLDVMNRLDHK